MKDLEISVQEMAQLDEKTYRLIDMRDDLSYSYGNIPGSIHIPAEELLENPEQLALQYPGEKLIIYCKKGENSKELVCSLQEKGVDAVSLQGGYLAWLMERMKEQPGKEQEREAYLDIEESIRKKFRKTIWCRFTKAIREYELVKEGDKVAVCISGGKDSMLMAKLFQELKRHNKFPFEVVFLVMDPGYSPENRQIIENNAQKLNIPVTIFESDIFESVFNIEKSPCYLCARMR